MSASLLPMQIRALEDAHEQRGFVPLVVYRPLPEANFEPSIYGEFEADYETPSTRPFDLRREGDRWFLNRGFLEGIPVAGTGQYIGLPAGGLSVYLRAAIAFSFITIEAQHVSPEDPEEIITVTTHHKAGPYSIRSADLLFLAHGTPPPAQRVSHVGTTDSSQIHALDLWIRPLMTIAADGSHGFVSPCLRLSGDLSEIV